MNKRRPAKKPRKTVEHSGTIDLGVQILSRLPIRNAIQFGSTMEVVVPWVPRPLASWEKNGVPKSRYAVPESLFHIPNTKVPNPVDVGRLTYG